VTGFRFQVSGFRVQVGFRWVVVPAKEAGVSRFRVAEISVRNQGAGGFRVPP
jgi:hypothetical protein